MMPDYREEGTYLRNQFTQNLQQLGLFNSIEACLDINLDKVKLGPWITR